MASEIKLPDFPLKNVNIECNAPLSSVNARVEKVNSFHGTLPLTSHFLFCCLTAHGREKRGVYRWSEHTGPHYVSSVPIFASHAWQTASLLSVGRLQGGRANLCSTSPKQVCTWGSQTTALVGRYQQSPRTASNLQSSSARFLAHMIGSLVSCAGAVVHATPSDGMQ